MSFELSNISDDLVVKSVTTRTTGAATIVDAVILSKMGGFDSMNYPIIHMESLSPCSSDQFSDKLKAQLALKWLRERITMVSIYSQSKMLIMTDCKLNNQSIKTS